MATEKKLAGGYLSNLWKSDRVKCVMQGLLAQNRPVYFCCEARKTRELTAPEMCSLGRQGPQPSNQQSAISNQQSAISNQQSAISNQQSNFGGGFGFVKYLALNPKRARVMEARGGDFSAAAGLRVAALYVALVCALFFPSFAFADTETAVASRAVANRFEDGKLLYYDTLHEAFEAAGGSSLDSPDEITLLADLVLDVPIIIENGKHIRLIAGNDGRTITRGAANIEYPVMWLRGHDASFTLGKPGVDMSLTIDGGYLGEPSIEARAPLVAANGQRSRLVMYGGVALQNNYNYSDTDGTHLYGNGAGVYLRTDDGNPDNQAEFIMRGGTIRGNINNTQNPYSCGGAVYISAFGLFTMEGGEILDNTANLCGGGFHTGSRGSFKKTGGVIYGADAEAGLRNSVNDGIGDPLIYGHAVCVALTDKPMFHFRDDTVGEGDILSYAGLPAGNGVFGEDEKWERPGVDRWRIFLFGGIAVLIIGGVVVFFFIRIRRKKQAAIAASTFNIEETKRNLTDREKEVFELLLTDHSLKEIAGELTISYSGVKFHTRSIYQKFGVEGRTELLVLLGQR